MSTANANNILLVNYICFAIAQPNCTTSRDYSVGIEVSDIWYSGSSDNIFFTICNDNINTNTSTTCDSNCLKWYEIEGGMPNRGEWYYFNVTDQPNIGNPTRMLLATQNNDQFCMERLEIDGTRWKKDSGTDFSCMEIPEGNPTGSCDIINIALDSDNSVTNQPATFTSETYDTVDNACYEVGGYNLSNKIVYPPIPLDEGTRLYTMNLEVSSVSWSGTSNTLYVRLCTDSSDVSATSDSCSQTCTNYTDDSTCTPEWFAYDGGVDEEGATYPAYWVTKDIGLTNYAQIVTFGSDEFCLSTFTVSSDNPSTLTTVFVDSSSFSRDCIEDDTAEG